MIKKYFYLLPLLILLFGCSTKKSNKIIKDTNKQIQESVYEELDLFDINWNLIKIGNSPVKLSQNQERISLNLVAEPLNYSGYSGCNRYFGSYFTKDSLISFNLGGSTKMACPDEDMRTESMYINALSKVETYKIKQDTLFLKRGDRVTLTYVLGK